MMPPQRRRPGPKACAALVALLVSGAAATAAAASTARCPIGEQSSTRASCPANLSFAADFIMLMGVEGSYHLHERFAVGARLLTILGFTGTATGYARLNLISGQSSSWHVTAKAMAARTWILDSDGGIYSGGELGYENRSSSGFTLGAMLGVSLPIRLYRSNSKGIPHAVVTLGRSW